MHRVCAWLLPCLFLLLAIDRGHAHASPAAELRQARASFLAGQYEAAISRLTGLLYPTSRLADASALAEAHLLLGVSFFETGKEDSAAREFEEALFLDSTLAISTSNFSERSVRFFEETKAQLERKANEAQEKQRLAEKAEKLRKAIDSAVIIENKGSYIVNFIPFGAGQFQNGHRGKGALFLIGQAASGGLSLGLWSYQVIRYGYRGRVPREEVDSVNTIQIVQITSGAVFAGLMLWGIADALSNYQYTVRREADPAFLDSIKDLFEEDSSTPTSRQSLRLSPLITPGGTGLNLSVEF